MSDGQSIATKQSLPPRCVDSDSKEAIQRADYALNVAVIQLLT
jgi:hypothetical protein